jgi:hypothetical protein
LLEALRMQTARIFEKETESAQGIQIGSR